MNEAEVADVQPSEAFESERLKLEGERLSLERERLAAYEEEIAAREQALDDAGNPALTFGPGLVAVVAILTLVVGAFLGGAAGFDLGRTHTPKPRKVVVSRAFLSLMNRVNGVGAWAREDPTTPAWHRTRTEFPETLVVVR